MKEKSISKVEVIDTGKPTLFCRCPVEFCGRLIDVDDRSPRYGFIEKITVYEEDGSETEHYNQIKMANRPSNHEPYGDFLVMVMDGCSYSGDNLGRGRYDYILSQLEEKGLKFKLELFLADLLKADTGCYSADSEVDPTKDTKGTFDYQNQIYRLGESDRFSGPYAELAVPFDKAKGAIIGEGIVVYDNKNPESVDLTEGVIVTPEDMLKFVESFHAIADKLGTDVVTEYDLQPVTENNVLLTKLFNSIAKYHSSRTLGTCNIRTGKAIGVRWIARNNVSQRDIVDALNRNLSFIDSAYITGERVKTVGLNEDNVVTALVDLSFGSKERLFNVQKLVYNAKERQVMIVKPVFEHGGANDENGNECLHSTQIKRVKDRTFVITSDMVIDLGNMFIYNKMNKHIYLRHVAKGKMTIMSTPQGHLFGVDK